MKNPKHLIIAVSLLMAASAQAQSWGFTLGNGAGLFYDQGKPLRSGGVALIAPQPVYYAAPQYYYRKPVVYPRPLFKRPRVVYPGHAAYIPRTPRTYYTSCGVSYPNHGWRRR